MRVKAVQWAKAIGVKAVQRAKAIGVNPVQLAKAIGVKAVQQYQRADVVRRVQQKQYNFNYKYYQRRLYNLCLQTWSPPLSPQCRRPGASQDCSWHQGLASAKSCNRRS
eukprot:1807492-Rhodomonas_salina.1